MKKSVLFTISLLGSITMMYSSASFVSAESDQTGTGDISFSGEFTQQVIDPENPDTVVDPGPSPSTNGRLRIDFVPQLNFWNQAISDQDQVYKANAQLFHGKTGPRGNFVQVSDFRATRAGWQLQLRQETQFRNETAEHKELNGAVISFDRSWANSTNDKKDAPIVSKDVIHIDNVGETYNLAEAAKGTGDGTWSIEFGASIENKNGQEDTLLPRLDKNENPILDQNFENQTVYENSAVTLTVPGKTKKSPVAYQTVLTWILSELP